jgi:hypothetical protein
VAGEVVAVNEDVVNAPESINADAYANWLFKIKPADAGAINGLLDAAATAKTSAPNLSPAQAGAPDCPLSMGPPSRERRCTTSLSALAHIMTRTSLTQLEARDAFIARHIGPTPPNSKRCCRYSATPRAPP